MTHSFGLLQQRNIILQYYVEHSMFIVGQTNAHDCYSTNKPSVSAVLFGFHGINLLKNLVSRELLRILENFHFSISISKHFDFTFHFSKKSESIFFHFALLEKEWKLFIFTFHFSNFKNPLSLVPATPRFGTSVC